MNEIEEPKQPQIRFSLSLKRGADPASVKSQLEGLIGEELHIIDVRSIDSISQVILKCSASKEAYLKYFSPSGQKQNLAIGLYSQLEDIIPDQDYLPD